MLKGSILVVLLILLIATPVVAGDPLDGNDGPAISRTTMNVEEECGRAEKLVEVDHGFHLSHGTGRTGTPERAHAHAEG